MPATASFRAPPHMPRGMTIPEWRALVHAARKGWLGYVIPFHEVVLTGIVVAAVIAAPHWLATTEPGLHPSLAHDVPRVLAWCLALRVLCRSIDWEDKRRLAFRIGLLPDAIREY